MGWNKIEQNTIGDEPLDLLSECVERIAQCYQDEVGRSPTSDELLASIMHVLNASGGMVIPDLAERQITALSLKTKKLPKTQKYEIGDCFAIPLQAEFRYGRILEKNSAGSLIEIYDIRSEKLLTFAHLGDHARQVVWRKHVNGIRAFRNRRWLIIGREEIPDDYDCAAFYTGTPFTGFIINRGAEREHLDDLPADTDAEPMIMFSPDTIEDRISANMPDRWPEVDQVMKRDIQE